MIGRFRACSAPYSRTLKDSLTSLESLSNMYTPRSYILSQLSTKPSAPVTVLLIIIVPVVVVVVVVAVGQLLNSSYSQFWASLSAFLLTKTKFSLKHDHLICASRTHSCMLRPYGKHFRPLVILENRAGIITQRAV